MKIIKILLIVLLILGTVFYSYKLYKDYHMSKTEKITPIKFEPPKKDIKKVKLSNGMTVLMFKNQTSPKVLIQIAYNIGSDVEESAERGLAHLIEHMIFKGTQKLSEGDIDAIARKYGASFNAYTGKEVTSYYFETNKNNWKPFVSILADVMQNARFDEQHLASELKAVIQELKMIKDRYWRKMLEKACELVYPPNHPYHFPIIGFKENLLNLTADKLKAFYKKYYQPDNATLFVVGDFDFDEVEKCARQNFESIPGSSNPTKKQFPSFPTELVVHNTRLFEDVTQEKLAFFWRIPGQKNIAESIKAETLASLIGSGEGSRLWRTLVEDKKVATSVSAMAAQQNESGIFMILITPLSKCNEKCKLLVYKELVRITEKGFTRKELSKDIRIRTHNFLEMLQNYSEFSNEWISSYFATMNEFDLFDKINQFEKLEPSTLQDFVKKYIDPVLMNEIQVLPLDKEQKQLSQERQNEADELDKEILQTHQRTAPVEEARYVNQLPPPNKFEFTCPKPTETFTLQNGLQVMFLTNNNYPLVSMACKFRDALHFSNAKEGILVNLMMDMLMEGNADYTKKDNVDYFENYGASYSFDGSGGFLSAISCDCKPLFERFVQILTQPEFANEALVKVKDIHTNYWRSRKEQPWNVTVRLLRSAIYGSKHPFSWSLDDAINEIRNTNSNVLIDLHKKYVSPSNMVLSVVGDFDITEMHKLIETLFGSWTGQKHKKIEYPKPTFTPQKIDFFMLRDQAVLAFGQPSELTIYHPDIIPLKLINSICFESLGSRLYNLREQTGIFYMANGGFAANATREHGFDFVGAMLSVDMLDKGEDLIKGMLASIAKNGVNQQDIDAARQMSLKSIVDNFSTIDATASTFCGLESLELGFDYYDKALQTMQKLTPEDLSELCAKYFSNNNMARIRVGRVGQKQ